MAEVTQEEGAGKERLFDLGTKDDEMNREDWSMYNPPRNAVLRKRGGRRAKSDRDRLGENWV